MRFQSQAVSALGYAWVLCIVYAEKGRRKIVIGQRITGGGCPALRLPSVILSDLPYQSATLFFGLLKQFSMGYGVGRKVASTCGFNFHASVSAFRLVLFAVFMAHPYPVLARFLFD